MQRIFIGDSLRATFALKEEEGEFLTGKDEAEEGPPEPSTIKYKHEERR